MAAPPSAQAGRRIVRKVPQVTDLELLLQGVEVVHPSGEAKRAMSPSR